MYQAGRDYSGVLEKKNALGMFTKKYATLTGVSLALADSEGGQATQTIDIGNVLRGGDGTDPLIIVAITHGNSEDKTQLKAESAEKANWWYDLFRNALEACGRQKPRNGGLPDVDPRHGLKFFPIPAQYQARFAQLDNAVLYWFAPVKKYGAKSFIGKHTTEERITFVTDKCLFVTKPDSEVTRCMRINLMTGLYTNVDVKEKPTDETFVVIKMKEPDYDLYVALPDVAGLIHVLCTLHKQLTKGKELSVTQVKTPSDSSVHMQLSRRGDFEMKVVVPLTKDALKIALDNFARSKGIVFTKSGQIKRAKDVAKQQQAAAGGGSTGGGAEGSKKAKDKPLTPLDHFFIGINLPQYSAILAKQSVDLEVLECMDDDDIKNFGVKDAAHVAKIREKLKDTDFMDKCKTKRGPADSTAEEGGASASPNSANKPPINFLDDSDDDLLGGPSTAANKPAPITFDDSDDDFLSLAPAGGAGGGGGNGIVLDLDSDDDFDLGGSKSSVSVQPISLDSDDDI